MKTKSDLLMEIEELRIELKEKVAAGEEKFRTLFESSRDAILLLDPEVGYQDCNLAALEMFSISSKEELLKLSPAELSPEYQADGSRSVELAKKVIGKAIGDGVNFFEWVHRGVDGREFPASVLATRIEIGGRMFLQGTIRDITRQKEAEEALRQSEQKFRAIVTHSTPIVFMLDREGTFLLSEGKMLASLGLKPGQVVGQSVFEIYRDFPNLTDSLKKALNGEDFEGIIELGELFFECFYTPSRDSRGNVTGIIGMAIDITERKRINEIMVQSEKMLSVGGLAAGMAHEINNPLAGMMQTADVMALRLGKNLDLPASIKAAGDAGTTIETIKKFMETRGVPEMIATINESGRRVALIVDNMLSFARKSDAQISSLSMVELLDKTLELAATDYDLSRHYDFRVIEIKKQYQENLPLVPCEGAKIQQVLLNILRNGAQAMQHAATKNPCFTLGIRLEEGRKMICMEIEDNGPGMDEATRKRVFEPFFTTKPVGVGTGLGLSVSYFIIAENHGGQMNVESSPGEGAKFIVRLPLDVGHF